MSPATASLVGAGAVVLINLLTAAFVYGKLTEKVASHERRIRSLEGAVFKTGD